MHGSLVMENKLEIKFNYQRQTFLIEENGVAADLFTTVHKMKYTIPFEEIQKKFFIKKGTPDRISNLLYMSAFLNIFLVLYIIVLVNNAPLNALRIIAGLLLLPFIFYLVRISSEYEEKHIESSSPLYFIYTKKNKVEIDNFIELIYAKQVEFFRKKYFYIDPILPYNIQFERYVWLYSNKFITENEYQVIKEDLDTYNNFDLNNI